MSASESSRDDRQIDASERRLQQAREEGRLPRSRDLGHFAAAAALLVLLLAVGPWIAGEALRLVGVGLRFDRDAVFETGRMAPRLQGLALQGLLLAAPIVASLAALLAAAGVALGGWNLTTQPLAPDFSRLDPLSGFSRLFAWRPLADHARVMLVATALIGAGWYHVSRHADAIDALARMPLAAGIESGFHWVAAGLAVLVAVAFVAALADVPLQYFKHRAELRMTQEEAKQEHRESEGDPHMKGERRRRAREMSRGRMLADVPKASVVVTNPTHYAVALQYEQGSTGAPRVVAMGTDLLALKIREVAAAARVPVMEAPPLARALYKNGEIGREVPVELYTAVAQVLAWVYRLREAVYPVPPPQIAIPAGMDPLEATP